MKFIKGDRVLCVAEIGGHSLNGKAGTVLYKCGSGYLVSFDDRPGTEGMLGSELLPIYDIEQETAPLFGSIL